ncbi:GTP 3',8-cyclase MoaA [Geobacter argillaceus]|uniref:GTP 3',8-cyclase n=1 Tax=Geobacter argillaceus TaxID=345631 RepID=A0A562WU95_9BACT|nr:GTP 3',8-cyclase MoaA [Geobacter argillaceus]TWJ33073.1 cyclic pyranopterin monophosphate synthase subunit MoaA [Geobacter argillaceus]
MRLIDSFGRKINYLRLSVTDRCNLRCSYCMPHEGIHKRPHAEVLNYEELFTIARASVEIGIEKIRITGGEPLVRRDIIPFLSRLAAIPGLKQLVLTTNGVLLDEMAVPLRDAGVQRLNISLDSFRPEIFSRITRRGDLARVLTGIKAAEAAGFPIKLNAVVMRGINDDELLDFAALTLERPVKVRFIEYMPTIKEPGWQKLVVPGEEIISRVSARYPLSQLAQGELSGPAREFSIDGAKGTVGIITPLSSHFCGECNRIRVTSAGMARSCLFSDSETDLKPYLADSDPTRLTEALRSIVGAKPGSHRLSLDESDHSAFTMAAIGG